MTIAEDTEGRWLRPLHSGPASRVQLVFLPHAGGSATSFRRLADLLEPWVDSYAVQYPGRQDRRAEPLVDTIPELAERIAEVLAPRAGGPLVLFGHSMGAVVAFEVARLIERWTGKPPAGLIASGRRAPARGAEVLDFTDDEAIRQEVGRLGGTSAQFLRDTELWEMIVPTLRADYAAIAGYEYREGPALGCPLSMLVGDADPRVSVADAQEWRQHTARAFRFRVFPGGHFYLAEPTTELAAAVADDLEWFTSGSVPAPSTISVGSPDGFSDRH